MAGGGVALFVAGNFPDTVFGFVIHAAIVYVSKTLIGRINIDCLVNIGRCSVTKLVNVWLLPPAQVTYR